MSTWQRMVCLRVLVAAAAALLLGACSFPSPQPPQPAPVLSPAGPLQAPVDSTVTFQVANIDGAVTWSVNGVEGGTTTSGIVANGIYGAPGRVPSEPTVTVTATDAADSARSASATVTVTAPGTLYVLNKAIYVYRHLDTIDGDLEPDRTFTIAGVPAGDDYYDITFAPALDTAFIAVQTPGDNLFRLANLSTASGTVAAVALSTLGRTDPSGLAYDPVRDILYVGAKDSVLIYDGAATLDDGSEPTRIITGPNVAYLMDWDLRLDLDVAHDRLFMSSPEIGVAVYDGASTIDGDTVPDRTIVLDASWVFFWGLSYDATRDELYIGDQTSAIGVYVVADASTSDGVVTAARTIGGVAAGFSAPSQVSYDATNDRLVVIDSDGDDVKIFDAASTLDGNVAPTRLLGGTQLPISYPYSGRIDPTQ